ncbi:MAG: hypothetical protein ACPGYU_01075 [Flavobacteriaceae bacterium]
MKSRWSLIFVVFTMVGLLLGTAYWLVFASNTKFENEYSHENIIEGATNTTTVGANI